MSRSTIIVILFILCKLLLHYFLIHPEYELHRDEFLHIDQGKHLAWGYISVPPLTSWISWMINHAGGSVQLVKFVPAFFGALTIWITWKIIKTLDGGLFAQLTGCAAVFLSAMLRVNILYQPNSFDIFFWTLTYFTVIRYIQTRSPRWLYLAGLAIGFGLLSKYNLVFLLTGLIIAIVLTKERKILINRHFYFAALLAFIIVLPNLIWQIKNEFPTFRQLNELATTQLANVQRANFIKEQILYFINSIFLVLIGLIGFWTYPPFKKHRFVFFSYMLIIAFYLFLKAKSYYAIGLYPVLLAFGAVYLDNLLQTGWKRWLRPVVIVVIVVLFIPIIPIAFPVSKPETIAEKNQKFKDLGLLRWEDGKDHHLPQDFADMLGWKEMAAKTDAAFEQITDKEHSLVLCDNYGEAGAINYYSKYNNINAVTFNADYINWINTDKPIGDVIIVKETGDDDPQRIKESKIFDSVILIGEVENIYAREKGTRIFLLKGAKADINQIIRNDIAERKRDR